MTDRSAWVFVVDDDPSIRKALVRLLRAEGWNSEGFASAAEFLHYQRPNAPSCLVLDVQMPEVDGLSLQRSLHEGHIALPVIFVSGHGDIPMSVQAIKAGAVDFLTKPVSDEALLRAVEQALGKDVHDRETQSDVTRIQQRYALLSPREREVLAHVVSGTLNKQIGRLLGVTEKTIKVHRGQVMHKMQARSLAELVRMAERIGIEGPGDESVLGADDLPSS
jgi:FixJ family two-component response regulator